MICPGPDDNETEGENGGEKIANAKTMLRETERNRQLAIGK